MDTKLKIQPERNNYKLTRLQPKVITDKLTIKTNQKIIKEYIYINSIRIIANY